MRALIIAVALANVTWCVAVSAEETPTKVVSFHKDVRPIFQAHCQGCHQPAKPGGEFIMTSFEQLMGSGESGEKAIVPGNPDESELVSQITVKDGAAAMPKGKAPLSAVEIDTIRRWIAQGAQDDTPENAERRYDAAHPPIYTRPPVIPSLAYSPDGTLLAVAGFHEVLLRSGDGTQLLARLIGLSERIESVAFSPDGKRLAVAGGSPGRFGELQIWNVERRELELSIPVTFDTSYGASWSPDGKLVAIGCADSAVRAFDSTTGEQLFYNGAHDDWALDTIFSVDGSLLVSVGRDMSTKLYNVPTQRFIDNVTSITPGALKGGLTAVARHPGRNEILVGGSDGVPRIYRMERITVRVIGDDANLIRRFPAMSGRIGSVAYSPDGKSIVCASSLDGKGQVFTYFADVDTAMPDEIKGIVQKVSTSQSPEERQKLEAYVTEGVKLLTETSLPVSVYAIAYRPDGSAIAAAGADGVIRLINPADGSITSEFVPVDVQGDMESAMAQGTELVISGVLDSLPGNEALPSGTTLTAIEVAPPSVELNGPYAYAQLLVTGILNTGDRVDVTRLAAYTFPQETAKVSKLGRITPVADGRATVTVSVAGLQAAVPVNVSRIADPAELSFIRDVNPVLSRMGCNQGTCHGSKDGKNGFKLSLRGYDPIYDVRSFTDDHKSRRTNVASPDASLMLLKASGAVPHMGGQLTRPGESYYEIVRAWIAQGARLDLTVPRVKSITIEPQNPVVQSLNSRQQLRVLANYTDGSIRDVTAEAHLESGNTEVAEVDRASATMTAIRRGEAPVLARYEGSYAATTLTVMGDRTGFVWQDPEVWSEIDKLVAAKWERMKIQPSGLCTDEEFIRRATLDLTGLPPSAEEVVAFVRDSRPTREKRDALVDRLIGSEAYIDYWTNKWADLLQVNGKFLGGEGAAQFRKWIRDQVASNRPYDEFCRAVLTAGGSNKENPPASYFKILRDPDVMMENTTHLFLGVRFNCNKCHDHPFERWTQDQYYETAAFFARVGLQRDPKNAAGDIGGTAVEGAKPLWEEVIEKPEGEMKHDRTGQVTAPRVPFDREIPIPADQSRREQLASWITSPENDYFARSYVNRVWGYLMGIGLIEPLDDIRAGNPPTNPQLLDALAASFIDSGFNVRDLMASICKSRTYQLEIGTNDWNADDKLNYSHALPKRLPAEVLYDAVYTVTGSKMRIPGVPEGTRAAALPDVAMTTQDGFLASLGRPVRESACECERSSGLQLGPVMALMNGPTVSDAISQPGNAIEQLVATVSDDPQLINNLFLRILNREARPAEIEATIGLMNELNRQHQQLVGELAEYEAKIAPALAEREARRQTAIAQAKQDLDAYVAQTKEEVEKKTKAREERIAAARKLVDDHLATAGERLSAWEQAAGQSQTAWSPLEFNKLTSQTRAELKQEEDRSVFVSGPNDRKGAYVLNATTAVQGITAVKLELLTDDRLPARGPGRAQNGNFVLTELSIEAWPKGKPDRKKVVKLQNAKADFSQANFDVAAAIDGQGGGNNGWASSPKNGEDRTATFELAEPLTLEGEIMLQIKMDQQYPDNMHTIGKFRISVTTNPLPVDFGLPQAIRDILAIAPEQRSDEQKQTLLTQFNEQDAKLQELKKGLAEAEKPLPEDPRLVELRNTLAEREKPLPEDPQLARLRRAKQLSEQQLQNQRLTVAQDLAWALINSPAFLFNR